ncbi:hypothetical protein C8R44DRAFT_974766 [Mycena epipterygia]|nr:hypothetical protein C8R44DRAFT_974766 [Mycena epipterygia]
MADPIPFVAGLLSVASSVPSAINTAVNTAQGVSWLKSPVGFEATAEESLKVALEILMRRGDELDNAERLELQSRYWNLKQLLQERIQERQEQKPSLNPVAYSKAREQARLLSVEAAAVADYATRVSEQAIYRRLAAPATAR